MSRARLRVIKHAGIQSEIRRNDAEAKKMEAEAKKLDEPLISIRIIIKYSIAGVVAACLFYAFGLDTFKNFYDLKLKEGILLNEKKEEIEKQYLEVLIKDATVNAYSAYVEFVMREEIYLEPTGKYASKSRAQHAYSQACRLVYDYWSLVVKIAEETREELFPDAKQKISGWLKEREKKDLCPEKCRVQNGQQFFPPIRRKSLDLIKRHVAQVRAGNSQLPDDLVSTFIKQPEFQEPGNEENSK